MPISDDQPQGIPSASPGASDLQKLIFEEAADSIFITDPQGRLITVNPRTIELFGYSREQLIGMHLSELIHPDDLAREPLRLENLSEGRIVSRERRLLRKDGSLVWAESRVRRLPEGNILGITIDISERRQVETTAQRQTQELAAVHALNSAISVSLNLDQVAEAALQGMREATGADLAFLFLREDERLVLHDLLPPEQRPRLGAVGEHRVGECICGLAVREGRSLYSVDIHADTRCTWHECKKDGISSFAALPLKSGEEVIGVIGLASLLRHDFETQASFLEALGQQTAMALANARLYATAQRELAERHKMEAELKQISLQLDTALKFSKSLLAAIPIPVFYKDRQGRYLGCNPAFTEFTGYTDEQLQGKTVMELWPSDYASVYHQKDLDLMKAPRRQEYEFSVIDKNQRPHSVIYSKDVFYDESGTAGIVGAFQDITERKKTEELLNQNRLIIENSPVVLFRWRAEEGWPVELVSENVRQFGYEAQELLSGSISYASIVHADDLERVGREVEEFSHSGVNLFKQEYRIVTRDGHTRWTDDRTVIERDATGTITHYQGIVIDCTERKVAEEALRESQELFAKVFAVSPAPMVISDIETGRFIDANEQWLRMMELRREEIVGRTSHEIGIWEDPERRAVLGKKLRKTRMLREESIRLVTKSGKIKDILGSAEIVNLGGSEVMLSLIYDITERKRAEEALRESQELFAAFMANNPSAAWITDRNGVMTYTSPGYSKMFLIGDPAGRSLFDIYPEPIAREYAANNEQVLAVDTAVELVESGLRADGSQGSFLVYKFPVRLVGGSLQVGGTAIDITERRRAEEELRAKIEEMDQFFSVALDLLCIADTNGYFRRLNPQWEQVLGYSLAELEQTRFLDLVHPDDLEATLASVNRLDQQETVLDFVNRYRCQDGSYRWIEWRSVPAGDLIYAAARDITLRKQVDEKLRLNRMIVENSPVVLFRWRAAAGWPVVFVSENVRQFGYEDGELLTGDIPFASLIHPDDLERVGRQVEQYSANGTNSFQQEYRIYIAAFVNSTKGLQWTQATKRKYIGAENLGNRRCGNCWIITLMSSTTGTTIFSLVNMASSAR
jgi:PAS domain S-box-containing protein